MTTNLDVLVQALPHLEGKLRAIVGTDADWHLTEEWNVKDSIEAILTQAFDWGETADGNAFWERVIDGFKPPKSPNFTVGTVVGINLRGGGKVGGTVRAVNDEWLTIEDADGDRIDIRTGEIAIVITGPSLDRQWAERGDDFEPASKPAFGPDEIAELLAKAAQS